MTLPVLIICPRCGTVVVEVPVRLFDLYRVSSGSKMKLAEILRPTIEREHQFQCHNIGMEKADG